MNNECCGEAKSKCRCIELAGHDGPHACECGGSWNPDGSIAAWPEWVVEDGGEYPKGSRLPDFLGLRDS